MLKRILSLVVLSFSICSAQTDTKLKAVWTQIDTLHIARYSHAVVVLHNGNILVSGGVGNGADKSCEIYDLQTQKWRLTSSMNTGRTLHKMFLLKNNKVLAVGGYNQRSCEIYDPETETWAYADSIPTLRNMWESILQLSDGTILISGGEMKIDIAPFTSNISNCDLYNPETGMWKTIAPLNVARRSHSLDELNNGKILAAGGIGAGKDQLKSCEIYDPVQDSWTITDSLNIQRDSHTSYLLPDGNVLVAGGYYSTSTTYYSQNSCEVYDVKTNTWSVAESMLRARSHCDTYRMNIINKLIMLSGTGLDITWEAYDPVNIKSVCWGDGPSNKLYYNNSVQMKDERVMLTGGEDVFDIETLPRRVPSNKCYILSIEIDMAVEKTDELPKDFCLYQNYPNPFNPATKIKFSISKASRISLTVFDMLGRIVTKLIDNEEKPAGVYAADFNARGLASGVYLYQLTAGNRIYTNKMLLAK